MNKISFWAVTLSILLGPTIYAGPPYYEILTAIWLAPGVGNAAPVVKTFTAPSNYMNLWYSYSGPTFNSTNHPTYSMLKIEKLDANGNPIETLVNLKKPLPSKVTGSTLQCTPGATYRVSIFDNGSHVRGKRRPWVIVYYDYWQ